MKTRLPAFTIIELMVVMLLSIFVFSTMLLVVRIMNQQGLHQEEEHKEILSFNQLKTLLQKDTYKAKLLFVENKVLFCDFKEYSIEYKFESENMIRRIVRQQIHSDTFDLPTQKIKFQWQNHFQENGWVDGVHWQTTFLGQPISIRVNKNYDTKTLMQQVNYVYTVTN